MIPLRFKAVCTETGREFGESNLGYSGVELDKWGYAVGQTWSIEFEDENEDPRETDVRKIQICQSTGLTDIKKNDLYFNDAIYYCGVIYYLEWSEGQIMLIPMEAHQLPEFALDLIESGVMCGTVIGNRWMPFDELKARAEAVYPKQNQ